MQPRQVLLVAVLAGLMLATLRGPLTVASAAADACSNTSRAAGVSPSRTLPSAYASTHHRAEVGHATQIAQLPADAGEDASEAEGEEEQAPATGVQRPTAQLPGMPLRPGDVLMINVRGEPGLSGNVYIRDDGTIDLPVIGSIEAAGSTVEELSDEIAARLDRYVVEPRVSVLQVGGVPRVVAILGAVQHPGTYDVRQYSGLLQLLAAAGGPRQDADMERAMIVRGDEHARIATSAGEGGTVVPHDVPLQPGDTVMVPSVTERSVRVAGAVASPGLMALEQGVTASRAVLAAGGPVPGADLTGVQLLRGPERMTLNLRPILHPQSAPPGEEGQDAQLQIDDIIIVPRLHTQSALVIGAVQTPGPQMASEAQSASGAVAMAGGATSAGDLERAYVLRDGRRIELNLRPLLEPDEDVEADEGVDAPVEPGDVVVVPEARPVFVIGAVTTPGPVLPQQADTLSRAIVVAGGLAPDADMSGAYVLRGGEQVQVDLRALLEEGDASADVALQPQDAVIVPTQPQVVTVVGQVAQPGSYPLEQAGTIADAWALAGGPALLADTSACVLLRGDQSEMVNVEALLNEGDAGQNRELQAGDTLIVPKVAEEVYIFGQVGTPGVHPIHEGDTVIDVIASAGGPAAGANVNRIALIRRGAAGQARPGADEPPAGEESGPAARERPGRSGWADRWGRAGAGAEEPDEREREQRVREQIAEGHEAIRLFDLADVREGDPAFLARPGDMIWVPPTRIGRSTFDYILERILAAGLFSVF